MPPKRRLSEGSDAEEEEETGPIEEGEKVRVGPGRPKKKKIDPTQQMQASQVDGVSSIFLIIIIYNCSLCLTS